MMSWLIRRTTLLILTGMFVSAAAFTGIIALALERYTTGCWFNQRAALKEIAHVDGATPILRSNNALDSCSVKYIANGTPEEVISYYDRSLKTDGGWGAHPISLVGNRSANTVLNRSKGYLTYEVVAATKTDGTEPTSDVSVTVYLSDEYDW